MTNAPRNNEMIENTVFDEIRLNQSARLVRTLTEADIRSFAAVSGDTNPAHLDPEYANHSLFHGIVAHGMWSGALISTLLGTIFPGPGTIYLEQTLHFKRPVRIGDTLTIIATVQEKNASNQHVTLTCSIINQHAEQVLDGVAKVLAPTQKLRIPRIQAPHIQLFEPQNRFKELLALCGDSEAIRCAVVHPCDPQSLLGAIQAAEQGLIEPVFIGPEQKIRAAADAAQIDLSAFELEFVAHSHAAAERAARWAAEKKIEAMMKGSLHTEELMHAVLAERALRTKRRISHLFRFDVPLYPKPLYITDAALNISPTLDEKVDIVQNAIDAAHVFGIAEPKVAILSAVETVNAKIPSTLDAAALCKMADRKQIYGGLIDGPLAFDNAVSLEAAKIKQIDSAVAGNADILVVPDLESGNMLSKQLEYLAGATGAGVVLGARIPIALTSRADSAYSRMTSALLAKLIAHQNRKIAP